MNEDLMFKVLYRNAEGQLLSCIVHKYECGAVYEVNKEVFGSSGPLLVFGTLARARRFCRTEGFDLDREIWSCKVTNPRPTCYLLGTSWLRLRESFWADERYWMSGVARRGYGPRKAFSVTILEPAGQSKNIDPRITAPPGTMAVDSVTLVGRVCTWGTR